MTFSPGGPVVALDLAVFPPQLARSYAVGGVPLPTQPTIATAPLSLGGHLSLGDTFALLFAAPDALTRSLLANGAATTMQFLLPGGVLVSAPVSLAASYSAPTLSVVVTLLASVSTLPADLPLLLLPSTKAGAFMTVGVFGRLPTDLSGFPVLGVYDPSTHSVLAAQAAPAALIQTDSTNSIVYAPLYAYVPAFQDTYGSAGTATAATTFSGTPTVAQLVAGSYATLTNVGNQATFQLEVNTTAFVGTLSFYGLEPDGVSLQLISAHQRSTTTIATSSAINTAVALNQVWTGNIAGFKALYVICTAFTSGSASLVLGLSAAPYALSITNTVNTLLTSALPAGTNVIGHVITDSGSITVANATAPGQALMVASSPVVIASDQGAVAGKRSGVLVYSTTQTGISATADSGDLQVGQYTELGLLVNLTAFTGTSIQFRVRMGDSFSNYYNIASPTALVATGSVQISVGMGAPSYNTAFGNIVRVQWLCSSVTSATFTVSLYGK